MRVCVTKLECATYIYVWVCISVYLSVYVGICGAVYIWVYLSVYIGIYVGAVHIYMLECGLERQQLPQPIMRHPPVSPVSQYHSITSITVSPVSHYTSITVHQYHSTPVSQYTSITVHQCHHYHSESSIPMPPILLFCSKLHIPRLEFCHHCWSACLLSSDCLWGLRLDWNGGQLFVVMEWWWSYFPNDGMAMVFENFLPSPSIV